MTFLQTESSPFKHRWLLLRYPVHMHFIMPVLNFIFSRLTVFLIAPCKMTCWNLFSCPETYDHPLVSVAFHYSTHYWEYPDVPVVTWNFYFFLIHPSIKVLSSLLFSQTVSSQTQQILRVFFIWMKCPLKSLEMNMNKSSSLGELNTKEQGEERPGIVPVHLISKFIKSPVQIKWSTV